MSKLLLASAALTLAALSAPSLAADLMVDQAPMMVEPTVAESGIKGTVDLGLLANYVDQNDDDFQDTAWGGYIGADLWGSSNNFYWGADGYFERNSFDVVTDEAPYYVGTLGGHLGFAASSDLMLGGFVSGGITPGYEDDLRRGYTVGVEGMAKFDSFGVFGQLGYADVETDSDNQFKGYFVRGGALFSLSDDFAVLADASYGHTDTFEDVGDEGEFYAVGIKGAWKLPTDFDAFITAGYEYGHYEALSEPDAGTGESHIVKLGLSIPFGDGTTAADALNPLGTSAAPYRAASWASTLD